MGGGNRQQPARTLELYVRSLSPAGARNHQEQILERIAHLDDEGTIAGYDVHIWGDELCLSAAATQTDAGQFVRNRVSAFKQWAQENGVSFESGFDAHETQLGFTEEEYTTIEFPMMTLAEFQGDNLVSVAPGSTRNSAYTISDRLNALADGTDETPEISDGSLQRVPAVSPTAGEQPLRGCER